MSDTHYVAAFTERYRGRDRAVCGRYLDEGEFSTEPTCPICRAWVAEDDAGFASLTEPEQEPEPEPRRRLTRQEQLEGLADRGCDTIEEYKQER